MDNGIKKLLDIYKQMKNAKEKLNEFGEAEEIRKAMSATSTVINNLREYLADRDILGESEIYRKCVVCGREFEIKRQANKIYCSASCQQKAKYRRKKSLHGA